MMKKHATIAESLAVYRDLDDSDRREVDRHVQDCAACAARLAAYRTTDLDLAKLTDPRPDERLRDGFYAAIGAQVQQARWFTRIRHRLMHMPALAGQMVELAILVLLIAGLGVTLRGQLRSPLAPKIRLPSPHVPTSGLYPTAAAPSAEAAQDDMTSRGHTTGAGIANNGHTTDLVGLDKPTISSLVPAVERAPLISPQDSLGPQIALAQGEEEEGQVYIVQADDSLWKLAEKYLEDGNRFGEIVEATRAKHAEDPSFALIQTPGYILPGSKLWIPAAGIPPSSAEAPQKPLPAVESPDGHIAFSFWNDHPERCTYEINVIDVAACLRGVKECQSTRRIFSLNNASEPALSPGGDRLAFRGWGEPPSEASPYLHCAAPVKARYLANTTLVGTEFRGTGGFFEDSHPNWSPDGQQILFDSERHDDGVARILLINADGSNERDLYIAGQHPSWAPDGQRFVYRGCDLTGNRCGLWLAYATSVKSWEVGINMIRPVVQGERAAHPDWSPTSDQIVYQSPAGGSWDLYVVNADTPTPHETGDASPRQLTNDPGIEGLPDWSPDGQWIAYLSDAGGNWGIWITRADGSERHLLFPFDGGIFTPKPVEPYGQRDWIDEQISWSK